MLYVMLYGPHQKVLFTAHFLRLKTDATKQFYDDIVILISLVSVHLAPKQLWRPHQKVLFKAHFLRSTTKPRTPFYDDIVIHISLVSIDSASKQIDNFRLIYRCQS
ncbi:hypothetical protein CEXT_258481 [Caerostris extrusa]|uniref:Uncharacterized protein n=1 Tax=Caerostris extrusa TaxID=172846 RepID=A0AAV4R547_CAEEX|nr:hypothetical protein CEXT_258481 [Caerostris extrusa]